MTLQPDAPSILRGVALPGTRTNRSFVEQLGLTAEELQVRPLLEWIHPEDQGALGKALTIGSGSVRARHSTKRKDDWLYFDWSVKTGADGVFALGRLAGPSGALTNAGLTAATKGEGLEAMALIVEASNPGMRCSILLVDPETGRIVVGAGPSFPAEYNAAVEELHIGPAVGSCGTAAFWNVPVVVENIAEDPLWRDLRGAAAIAGVCACWSHPITANDGTVLGAVAIYADDPRAPNPSQMDGLAIAARMIGLAIDRDRLEEQLRQVAQLEAIGRLAGGIAHDFKNLLTVIIGHVELMRLQAPSAPAPQTLEAIALAVDRASKITSQLLAFGRKRPHRPERVELSEAVFDVMRLLNPVIGDEISVSVVSDPSTGWITIDGTQLSQIMLNLVLNARDAMPAGGRLEIETRNATRSEIVRVHPENPNASFVSLTVTDDGRGMSPMTKGRVFEPFFSTKEGDEHSGLGLATVYGLTRQNGGHVSVRSEVGRGTTFSLYFPSSGGAPGALNDAAEKAGSQGAVLVVEDSDEIRELMTNVLASEGYAVTSARNGVDAIAQAEKGLRVDVLVADVMMPKIGGVALAQRLRQLLPSITVLFVSGRPLSAAGVSDAELRRERYLAKPFRPQQLVTEVRHAFQDQGVSAAVVEGSR
jgi:signal transduction histidine kinase/ActR/RegA family two-component response regulator